MQSFLLQFALNLSLRIYRRSASKPSLSTNRDMENKINLHLSKREAVLMGNIQVTAGNNKAVRKAQLSCRFPRFIPLLGLIKSRGQERLLSKQGQQKSCFRGRVRTARQSGGGMSCRAEPTPPSSPPHHRALVPCPWGLLPVRELLGGNASFLGSPGHWHHVLVSRDGKW